MSRELLAPEGLRVDGRRPPELRRLLTRVGLFAVADGSAYVELGNTKCLAAVYGPKEPRTQSAQLHDRAVINVEYNVASFSSGERKSRTRRDKRLLEIASVIKRTFEPVVMTATFPRSEIDIYIQILQLDGGALHAAINASCLAMIDAGIPMSDYVVACSAGFASGTALLDLNYIEESAETPALTVAMLPKSGKLTMLNMESRLHLDHFKDVLDLATEGCKSLAESLDEAVRKACKTPRPI
ncbi:Exosome non-catalytic core component [Polyrhizophydium stewartii]|uniref:Exosome non-catalytic core component n=1 Tax=Polyrhizophydium stewartii TaxID=2732419 RepID=A0ABR4NHJ9_9FUNG|nr:Exosome complex component RRP41 [Polyrhizophydium stewartii]